MNAMSLPGGSAESEVISVLCVSRLSLPDDRNVAVRK
jgi:hypothetical protein